MRYLGSKTLLLESILNITRSYSEGGVFCDPFGGIGTVGSYMKKNGYQILSGDIAFCTLLSGGINRSESKLFLRQSGRGIWYWFR